MQRIERRHRLLEDDRDVVAANAAHVVLGRRQKVAAIEQDAARWVRRVRIRQQLQNREPAGGFFGAGFADQRHALTTLDRKRNAVDRGRDSALLAEGYRELADI